MSLFCVVSEKNCKGLALDLARFQSSPKERGKKRCKKRRRNTEHPETTNKQTKPPKRQKKTVATLKIYRKGNQKKIRRNAFSAGAAFDIALGQYAVFASGNGQGTPTGGVRSVGITAFFLLILGFSRVFLGFSNVF